jgi:predicted transcriptional regulator
MPKKERIGKAFQRALAPEEIEGEPTRKGEPFKPEIMNENRREILQYLSKHPCSYLSKISKELGLSFHTTKWHLRKIIESGYVANQRRGKRMVFYPKDMIALEDIPLFELLNTPKAKSIYLKIMEQEGISQKNVCRELRMKHQAVIWYTSKLEDIGLISSLEDGKFKRYYPTDLLSRWTDINLKRLRSYRDSVLKRLEEDRLKPVVIRSTEEKLVVRISMGSKRDLLTLWTDPVNTVLIQEN